MAEIVVELCPETGLCSLVKAGGAKTDLMPDEVAALRGAASDLAKARAIVAEVDASFGAALGDDELRAILLKVG